MLASPVGRMRHPKRAPQTSMSAGRVCKMTSSLALPEWAGWPATSGPADRQTNEHKLAGPRLGAIFSPLTVQTNSISVSSFCDKDADDDDDGHPNQKSQNVAGPNSKQLKGSSCLLMSVMVGWPGVAAPSWWSSSSPLSSYTPG